MPFEKTITTNKRATFDYTVLKTFQAGIQLYGNEVKSVKKGYISIKSAYITVINQEVFLLNAHISHYQNHLFTSYEPDRTRKLLLKRSEIAYLRDEKSSSGLTIIPTRVYLQRGRIKLEIGLARGKKSFDKRTSIQEREEQRRILRELRS